MAFVIDPDSISFSQILADLQTYRESQPEDEAWTDFFQGSVGVTLEEMIAGLGAYFAYKNVVGRRENFIQYAQNRSSLVGISENLGYSSFRGFDKHLTLTITPSVSTVLTRFSIVGNSRDRDLVVLQDTPINVGVQQQIEVAVGPLKSEEITIQNSNIAVFRFTSANVSEDYRLLLNGTEVDFTNQIIELKNDRFVALTNVLGAIDVMYLNQDTAPVQYANGDILRIEYLELKDTNIDVNQTVFDFGTLDAFEIASQFFDVEGKEQIRVNAPLFHESQKLVRGREDYLKTFRFLNTNIFDTNQRDVTPAVIELSYVRTDKLIFTAAEKAGMVTELSEIRTFGVEPPLLTDPTRIPLNLTITLTFLSNQTGDAVTDVEAVISSFEKMLEQTFDLLDVEQKLEAIPYVQTARIKITGGTWSADTSYERGTYLFPTVPNGRIYELGRIRYLTGDTEPTFPTTNGDLLEDGDIIWITEDVDLCESLVTWTAETEILAETIIVPTLPNGKQYRVSEFINRSFGEDEVQQIDFDLLPDSGTWRITFNTEDTTDLAYNASALDVQNALNALSQLNDVVVTGNYTSGFTITYTGEDGNKDQPEITIDAGAGDNEQQLVSFDQLPNSGAWRLNYAGQDTSVLSFSITDAQLQTELLALSNIDGVAVTGDFINGFLVEFQGSLAATDVALMTQTLFGDPGQDEIQEITFDLVPDAGSWRLHYDTEFTGDMPFSAGAVTVQSELNNLSGLSSVIVTGDYSTGYTVQFQGADGTKTQPLLEVANAGRNEIQTVLFSTVPDSGTWRIHFGAEKTTDLAHDASTAAIETALNNLTSLSGVTVSGDYSAGIIIEFDGSDGLQPQAEVEINDVGQNEIQRLAFSLEPDSGSYTLDFGGQITAPISYQSGTNEVQRIDFSIAPDAGDFSLVFDTQQTALIPSFADANTVRTALEALSNVDVVGVTGSYAAGFEVTFSGVNAVDDVPLMTVGSNTLTDNAVAIFITITEETTGFRDDAAGIKEALELLSNIDTVNVTGDYASDFLVEFTGDLSVTDVNQITVNSNTLLQGVTAVSLTVTTDQNGESPANNIQRLSQAIVITVEETQSGLLPGNSLLQGATPVVISNAQTQAGFEAEAALERNSVPVEIVITEEVTGAPAANNLLSGASPVVITPSTVVDATAVEPIWPNEIGATISDGDIIWIALELNGTPATWAPYTHYRQGDYVSPCVPIQDVDLKFLMFQAFSYAGQSGLTEPTFSTVVGNEVLDNRVTWIARDPDSSPAQIGFNEYYDLNQTITIN